MTIDLTPLATPSGGAAVGDWHPTRCPPTLSGTDDFTTEGDRLLAAFDAGMWRAPEGAVSLDVWQRWLIRRLLETYPPDWPVAHLRGQLRYKRVVVSMARQNGKSLIGALLLLYFVAMHYAAPKVGVFASIERQAGITYDRLRYAIDHTPALSAKLKTTKTRGITHRDGPGILDTFASSEDSVQGEPFTASLYDELHLGDPGLWDAIVLGQRTRANAMLAGFTTAGDDESVLLKRLYKDADAADERFGLFLWEAPSAELTEANMIAANPAVACGRISLESAMYDARQMWTAPPDVSGVSGRDRVTRYLLNRFVAGSAEVWVPPAVWADRARDPDTFGTAGARVIGVDRTADWEHAVIVAAYKTGETLQTEIVATITDPTEQVLYDACQKLATSDTTYVMPADRLKGLALRLKKDGRDARALGYGELADATATTKAAIRQGRLEHAGDPLTRLQSAIAKLRHGDGTERISRTLSAGEVDAMTATIAAVWARDTAADVVHQLF